MVSKVPFHTDKCSDENLMLRPKASKRFTSRFKLHVASPVHLSSRLIVQEAVLNGIPKGIPPKTFTTETLFPSHENL